MAPDPIPVLRARVTSAAGGVRAVLKQVFADTPTSPGIPADNQATMFMALTCGDAECPHDVDGYACPA
ncbi:hypothetical protein ACIBJF_31445 [Streptomyces sp. NPDC050743]|uniref:hypothetical protein n=1 Tax=Streptomyces sp. NPDC050743 TaxID=3365634 RepID=UPI003797EAE4